MPASPNPNRQAFGEAFKVFPRLETERLILDEILIGDAEDYFRELRAAHDMPGRAPWAISFEMESLENTRRSIQFAVNAWKKKSSIRFAIRLRDGDSLRLIGMAELFDIQNQYMAELGYWLGPSYQGQGLMTEAIRVITGYALTEMNMGRVFAKTSSKNLPSIAMLEKVGFQREGLLKKATLRDGVWDDTVLLAKLSDDSI